MSIVYLSGAVRTELLNVPNTGYMIQPFMGNKPDLSGVLFAVDTGCFAKPEKYTDRHYLGFLATLRIYQRTCLFATAPDVFGDGPATLAQSLPVLPIIRAMGYPAALVAQPGLRPDTTPWDEIDCLFVGGPDEWQRSQMVDDLVQMARQRGIWTHKGRVNSRKRLTEAVISGYDSADGTFVAFGPDVNIPRVRGWMDALDRQPMLWNQPAALHPDGAAEREGSRT